MSGIDWGVVVSLVALIIAVVGAVIARDRQLTNMIHTNHTENTDAIKAGDDSLHERINRTRDEMSNGYVRRIDMDGHLGRIEKTVENIRKDMKDERHDTNLRLDAVLQAIANNNKA